MNHKNISNEINILKKKLENTNNTDTMPDLPIIIDKSQKYIKKLHFKRNCKTEEEYIKCQIDFFSLFKQNEKFCLLFSIGYNDKVTPNIDYIIQMINMFKKIQTSIESKIICSAFIIENPIFEWVFKFGLKLYKPIKPIYVFQSEEEGLEKLSIEIKKAADKK